MGLWPSLTAHVVVRDWWVNLATLVFQLLANGLTVVRAWSKAEQNCRIYREMSDLLARISFPSLFLSGRTF